MLSFPLFLRAHEADEEGLANDSIVFFHSVGVKNFTSSTFWIASADVVVASEFKFGGFSITVSV
jgi:hypothetical protein